MNTKQFFQAAALGVLTVQSLSAQGLWGIWNNRELIQIDPATAQVIQSVPIVGVPASWPKFTLAYHPGEGVFYGFAYQTFFEVKLIRYELPSGQATDLGFLPDNRYFEGLEYMDSLDSLIVSKGAFNAGSPQLGTLSLSRVFTELLNNNGDNDALAYDSQRGLLYSLDTTGINFFAEQLPGTTNVLIKINLTNAADTVVLDQDPAHHPVEDAFYSVSAGQLHRWRVTDAATIEVNLIGQIPDQPANIVMPLAYSPHWPTPSTGRFVRSLGPAGKDTYIDSRARENKQNQNFGPEDRLIIGHADNDNLNILGGLVQFDLHGLPTSGVHSASLVLTIRPTTDGDGTPTTVSVNQVTSPWTENTVTWNTRPSVVATPIASAMVTNTLGMAVAWDITSLYLDWQNGAAQNYGLFLTSGPNNGGGFSFVSGENTISPALRPMLVVVTEADTRDDLRSRVGVSCVDICWPGRTNRTYQVQYQSELTANAWINLGPSVAGNGINCITDMVAGNERRFYRIQDAE